MNLSIPRYMSIRHAEADLDGDDTVQ